MLPSFNPPLLFLLLLLIITPQTAAEKDFSSTQGRLIPERHLALATSAIDLCIHEDLLTPAVLGNPTDFIQGTFSERSASEKKG